MAKKKKKTTKKEPTWDEIGKAIGTKIEASSKTIIPSSSYTIDKPPYMKSWMCYHKIHEGGFGRLLFIIGVLYALNYAGYLTTIPTWVLVLIVLGFASMRL